MPSALTCRTAVLALLLFPLSPALAGSNSFCGGAATPGDPSDLSNVVGDQTLEYAAQQPASIVTCAKGYLLEKCGDHDNAHKVFDKCIAAGYVGAMIWKALLLEDGTGVEADPVAAAQLMHRAATSQDPAYAPLGKLHYASMLQQGRGVARDEAAARQWFEAAAAEGSEEAREFLRQGYHTGVRDKSTLGVGTPPPGALVRGLLGENASENASISAVDRKNVAISTSAIPAQARRLSNRPGTPPAAVQPETRPLAGENAPPPPPVTPEAPGQRLTAVVPATAEAASPSPWIALGLLAASLLGALRRRSRNSPASQLIAGRLQTPAS